ncbi:hypothetical protein P280DRAFT_523375 [Massarina eburnea CBS 473.64]|uniref:Tafazzin n=1 Tax=Massarina eburnea CBS 473.64 TaxID=1395130 RepID=A0A6A6RID1_9PLEO|nr:hypothetical protein P280DRAFT_523375 [Massarina eburnea CBS 473.64]
MPKKHQPAYASIRPSHTSLNSPSSSTPPRPQISVNERITQLRREQAPRTTPQRRDEVTEVVTTRTVPPHLRRLLQLAEVDAPKPKLGNRPHGVNAARRGYSGPAAPSSWLSRSRDVARGVRKVNENGVRRFGKLARWHDAEFKRLPQPRSLVHHCLRTFAFHWNDLVEYEQHYLPSLPIPLKEAMLSYLSLYGHRTDLDSRTFKTLFQDDREAEAVSGWEDVKFLDLTGLLNEKYTLKDLEKSLQRSGASVAVTSSLAPLSPSSPVQKEKPPIEVVESWEDEAEDVPTTATAPTPSPRTSLATPIFPNLTRLSIAYPGPAASWADLLAISPSLNTLTHLSLASWPRPSTTPNAATASMVSEHGSVNLGGSHFYSDLDDDWHEAANILRRFSLNTYCLKWLDLEGCEWVKALTWDPTGSMQDSRAGADTRGWALGPSGLPGPDWNAAWRQITHLNLSQGWVPSDQKSLQNLPAGVICVRLMNWLREQQAKSEDFDGQSEEERREMQDKWEDVVRSGRGRTAYEVAQWVEREKVGRAVGMGIQQARKRGEGDWCNVEYGWGV